MRLGLPTFPIRIIPDLIFEMLSAKSVAIQTYSRLNFMNPIFSRYNTELLTGSSSLSLLSVSENPEKRLLSGTHSFVVYGAPTSLYEKIFSSSHDDNSVWEYFIEHDYYWLNIGLSLSETCTFLHYLETRHKSLIKYREDMTFRLKIYRKNETSDPDIVQYTHFGRKNEFKNFDCDWGPIQDHDRLGRFVVNERPMISIYPLEEIFRVGTTIIQKDPRLLIRKLK